MPEEGPYARDLMTADLISVGPDRELTEVARIMLECHITGLPVVDHDGRLLGMISETDLEREPLSPQSKAVDIMSYGAVTVPEDCPLADVAKVLDERHVRRAVVVRGEARRQLEDHARKVRADTKVHPVPDHGRVSRIFPYEGYGFIETADGQEIYFQRECVAEGDFDDLDIGAEVRFFVHPGEGEKGEQASTVVPVGKHHLPPTDTV